MARIFWESFEAQHDLKWTTFSPGDIEPATQYSIGDGSKVWAAYQNRSRTKTFSANYTELHLGCWMRPGLLDLCYRDGQVEYFFAWYKDTTRQISLAISNNSRRMTLYFLNNYSFKIAEGTHIYADQQQFFFELRYKMAATGGSIQTWFDGALDLNFDNANTRPSGDVVFNRMHFFSPNSGGFPAYFDSIMVNDTTDPGDGTDMGRTGIRHLWGQMPDADSTVNNAWTRSTGTNGWALVDERPPNTTDYVNSIVTGQKQGHTFVPHGVPTHANIKAVIHEHVMIKVTDGQVKVGQRQGGVEFSNPTENVTTSYGVNEIRRTKTPSDVDWSLATADATESLVESVLV